jgi:MFS family permease
MSKKRAEDEVQTEEYDPEKIQRNKRLKKFNLLAIFIGIATILALLIYIFRNQLFLLNNILLNQSSGMVITQAISATILALLTAIVQTWIFRNRISLKNRKWFILSGVLGGVIGGMIVGSVYNFGISHTAYIIGGFIGAITGLVSSSLQVLLMKNKDKRSIIWILFNVITYTIIWAIGWSISWSIKGTIGIGTAISAAFIMTFTGIVLVILLSIIKIDF